MVEVESNVRVLHGTRRGHLGRVVAVNFATNKVPLSLVRYRVRFGDGETEWYEAAMIEQWITRPNSASHSSAETYRQTMMR
jgi:ribosomal protein L24